MTSTIRSKSRFQFAIRRGAVVGALVGATLGTAACVQQNQAEVDQLRAQLKATQDELAALKAQQGATPAAAPAESAPSSEASAAGAPAEQPAAAPAPAAPPFEEALKAFEAEKRDNEWAIKREKGLLDAAKKHIAASGSSLNSVRCKTTSCAVIIDVPEKPKAPYQPLSNPWAETAMTSGEKGIYAKKTRHTYLIQRHTKDYPSFAEQRVDPLALAKQASGVEVASAPAAPAKAPVAGAPAAKPAPAVNAASSPVEAAKPAAAQPVSAPPAPAPTAK